MKVGAVPRTKDHAGGQSTHLPYSRSAQPKILCSVLNAGANSLRETTGKCVMLLKYSFILFLMVVLYCVDKMQTHFLVL